MAILEDEKPNLILAGRDEDVVFLSQLGSSGKLQSLQYPLNIPYGNAKSAQIISDKLKTNHYLQSCKLPHADTYSCDSISQKDVASLLSDNNRLIIKPRIGFASRGVQLLTHAEQVTPYLGDSQLILQEFLPGKTYQEATITELDFAVFHYSYQVLIALDGKMIQSFLCRHQVIDGLWQTVEQWHDSGLLSIGKATAAAMAEVGWWGFLNIEFQQDVHGDWKIIELNGRNTGLTEVRLWLGYDEWGLLLDLLQSRENFPLILEKQSLQNIRVVSQKTSGELYYV